MTLLIVMSLLLALVQIWFLPMLFSLNSMAYLLSNREEPNADQSAICARALRAAANLQESLPAFIALGLLSILEEVDNSELMMFWLGLRVAYALSYIAGVTMIRSLLWIGSIVCLVMMALALV